MHEFLEDNSAKVYVYCQDNHVVGFVWTYFIDNQTVHINYFVVLHEHRNCGIGGLLIKHIMNDYNKYKIELLVDKSNTKAINFYLRNGFEQFEYSEEKYKMILENLNERYIF